jgi:arylsulfatase A-like enzyme
VVVIAAAVAAVATAAAVIAAAVVVVARAATAAAAVVAAAVAGNPARPLERHFPKADLLPEVRLFRARKPGRRSGKPSFRGFSSRSREDQALARSGDRPRRVEFGGLTDYPRVLDSPHAGVVRKRRPAGLARPQVMKALLCLLCLLGLASVLTAAERKPNFVFLIADDHRWDAMGAVQKEQGEKARFPWFETPNMDRLAAGGVRFRNAFITHSICSPGRAGFLTGQYTHVNGVMDNSTPFPVGSVTHATLLRDAGYRTAYFGKWHMGNQRERPGFDHAASFINQGIYQNCPFVVDGVKTPTSGWVDDVTTGFAIDWLKENHGAGKPFSIVIGFKSPHNKRGGDSLPGRLRDLYAGKTTRRTPNCDLAAAYHKPLTEADKGKERGLSANAVHLDYLRHVKGIDENLGRVLDTLDELGLTEDTVVIYTSDNGYYLGERGLGDKRALYEEGLRIPFLVRYPRLFPEGQLADGLVINQDLAPTYLDLAGLPAHPGMHGASFKELARGSQPAGWRTSFLTYYRKELGDTPTCHGIRTTDAKLIVYPRNPGWTEVYDLKNDPYELNRLPADGPLATRLKAELEKRMKAVGFEP